MTVGGDAQFVAEIVEYSNGFIVFIVGGGRVWYYSHSPPAVVVSYSSISSIFSGTKLHARSINVNGARMHAYAAYSDP